MLLVTARRSVTVLPRLSSCPRAISHEVESSAGEDGDSVLVPAGVIGQAWRAPGLQAVLARVLKRCDEIPLDGRAARLAGQLCGQTGTVDVIDASVGIAVAESKRRDNEVVLLTSDADDMRMLISGLNTIARIFDV